MASITITDYQSATGCIYFTTVGISGGYNIDVQSSLDGANFTNLSSSSMPSPRCGFMISQPTYFRMYCQVLNTYSNIFSSVIAPVNPAPTTIPVGDRTNIEFETDIAFTNSPIHIRLQNTATDVTIQSANIYLWIWNGNQNATLGTPNFTFYKSKVSNSDKYINIEISEQIKSYLVSPLNAPNTNQPNFSYNELTSPAITGQGVFWQIVADITSTTGIERHNFRTSFGTLGYRYGNEQTYSNVFSAILPNTIHWFNPKVHDYFSQAFDFTKTVATATSTNMITFTDVTPPVSWLRESRDPHLIVYLNKLGLWELFTPHGKAITTQKKEMTTVNLSYRDPSRIDNSYVHSKLTDNFDVTETITINTGSLTEEMVSLVEQIVYSPKVYLIRFNGDVQETSTVGITIDNAYITIDSLNTTIDGMTIGEEYLSFYKTFEQIPVILTDTDFTKKNRVNDKNTIDYTLKFETTTNRILDTK